MASVVAPPGVQKAVPLEPPERQALWRGARSWSAAVVVTCFPLLFIVDRAIDPPFSPVLPGLVALLVAIVALPFGINEVAIRRAARSSPERRPGKTQKFRQSGRGALVASVIWFALWLAWGA